MEKMSNHGQQYPKNNLNSIDTITQMSSNQRPVILRLNRICVQISRLVMVEDLEHLVDALRNALYSIGDITFDY